MTRFLQWRKMTWVVLIWTVATAVAVFPLGFALAALVGVGGLASLSLIWFMSRPLWRVGHGARFRRLQSDEIAFKSVEGLSVPSR
jgi:hypothetical protein